jgi:hypothetical protein
MFNTGFEIVGHECSKFVGHECSIQHLNFREMNVYIFKVCEKSRI